MLEGDSTTLDLANTVQRQGAIVIPLPQGGNCFTALIELIISHTGTGGVAATVALKAIKPLNLKSNDWDTIQSLNAPLAHLASAVSSLTRMLHPCLSLVLNRSPMRHSRR